MSEKMDVFKKMAKKIIVNPYIIIIIVFGILMYFLVMPGSTKNSKQPKTDYKISSFDQMVKGSKKEISDEEEEKLLLSAELEEKPKKVEINKNAEPKKQEQSSITEEYSQKIQQMLASSMKNNKKKEIPQNQDSSYRQNVDSQEILKNVYSMLKSQNKNIIKYIDQNLKYKNIVGDKGQVLKIRGEIPVVCETPSLLCQEKIQGQPAHTRCITMYKNCMNPRDYQEISLDEFKTYKK